MLGGTSSSFQSHRFGDIISNMNNKILFPLPIILLLFIFSCYSNQEANNPINKIKKNTVRGEDPDMVMRDFILQEVSPAGSEVEFGAAKAYYYRSVDLIYFDDVQGTFGQGPLYTFSFPDGVYDRHSKSLVTTEKVTIEGGDNMQITGKGGVVDFDKREVTLTRDVVVTTPSLRVEGIDGVFDLDGERLQMRGVDATIENPSVISGGKKEEDS
jgi:hypothetical protein